DRDCRSHVPSQRARHGKLIRHTPIQIVTFVSRWVCVFASRTIFSNSMSVKPVPRGGRFRGGKSWCMPKIFPVMRFKSRAVVAISPRKLAWPLNRGEVCFRGQTLEIVGVDREELFSAGFVCRSGV